MNENIDDGSGRGNLSASAVSESMNRAHRSDWKGLWGDEWMSKARGWLLG